MNLTLTPAYGRDYQTIAAAKADWLAGKDFRIEPSGCYCSIRDLPHMREHLNIQWVTIRFKCLSRVAVIKATP